MKHSILKNVIADMHDIIASSELVERKYTFEDNVNYVLTGIRRAGKSSQLYRIVKDKIASGITWDQIIYINFEDERLLGFQVEDFNDVVQTARELTDQKVYFFFDEIQNINGWEHFARRLADANEQVYITGSNAKMLSSEMEAVLGGRYISKHIDPYDFSEYLTASGIKYDTSSIFSSRKSGQISAAFLNYINDGGFPESLRFRNKREYVESVYQKIFLGDIILRNDIRNAAAFRMLIKKISETVMHEVSYSKLHGALKNIGVDIGKNSIINYVSFAEDAYLLFHVINYVGKFSEKEGNPKYYFCDNGLLNLFLVDKNSALLENIVAIYLHQKYKDQVFYYKSTKEGVDIDFYVPDCNRIVQVAYSISDEDAREREVRNLLTFAKKNHRNFQYYIITLEEEEEIAFEEGVIHVLPAYRFLLGIE